MFTRVLTAAVTAALLSLSAILAAPSLALAGDAPDDSRTLLILSRDGAFAGKLAALAGRPLILDARDGATGDLLFRLTEAHGWSQGDRARWRADANLDAAALAVCEGRAAAFATLARPGDAGLSQILARCALRVIDLGDAVSRAFAGSNADLRPARVADDHFGPPLLGAASLLQLAPSQVADRRD